MGTMIHISICKNIKIISIDKQGKMHFSTKRTVLSDKLPKIVAERTKITN